MTYTVDASGLTSLVLNETDTVASVLQNVAIILNTWKGEVPQFRDFGLDPEILHRPVNVAKALLRADIIDTVAKYEPRATVVDVSFNVDSLYPDRLNPVVKLEVDDGT